MTTTTATTTSRNVMRTYPSVTSDWLPDDVRKAVGILESLRDEYDRAEAQNRAEHNTDYAIYHMMQATAIDSAISRILLAF